MSYTRVQILNSIGINHAVILPVNNTFQEVLFTYQCYCLWLIWYVLSLITNKIRRSLSTHNFEVE